MDEPVDPGELTRLVADLVRKQRFTSDLQPHDQQDVVQTAVLKCLEAFRQNGPPDNLAAFLETVVGNLGKDRLKQDAKRKANVAQVPRPADDDDDEWGIEGLLASVWHGAGPSAQVVQEQLLNDALARIKPEQAVLLRRRFREGWSAKELAAELQVSAAAVDTRVWQAKKALATRSKDLLDELRKPHPHVYGAAPQMGDD